MTPENDEMHHTFRLSERASLDERLCKAFARATGLPSGDKQVTALSDNRSRVTCLETGRWIDYDTAGWRIRQVADSGDQVAGQSVPSC